MEETLSEKLDVGKTWLFEMASITGLGVSYTLHDVNEVLQTVAIIVSILGGVAAMWNSLRRKK